jgi:SAM-dependent MidA family methyltransferase
MVDIGTAIDSGPNGAPFEIVELGGGRGTNANWILSYLQENKPHVYSSLTSYTLVDSSPSLHETQMKRFAGGPHGTKVRFVLKDLVDVAQGT